MATKTLNGNVGGFYDFGNDDVTIQNVTLVAYSAASDFNANSHANSKYDEITSFPPLFAGQASDSNSFTNIGDYYWLEIRTKGTITVTGVINGGSAGYIGGDGGETSGAGRGPYGSSQKVGGYLSVAGNGDPFNEKVVQDILSFSGRDWSLEKNRNIVYPGSGGAGGLQLGSSAGAGGGGCGAGVVRLIGDAGVIFNSSGRVNLIGSSDGGRGGDGVFYAGNASDCFYPDLDNENVCHGTYLGCNTPPWSGGWVRGSNGLGGRGFGDSNPGSPSDCCLRMDFASHCTDSCLKKPRDDGRTNWGWNYYPSIQAGIPNACAGPTSGFGGSGGGLLIRSFGYISFDSQNINLKGTTGTSHGGTLKVFHAGSLSSGILDPLDSAKASTQLKAKVGAFYNELSYSGYCPTNKVEVQSLISVATTYSSGEEKFDISFDEGQAVVPNQLDVSHGGFNVYRAINVESNTIFYDNGVGGSEPPVIDNSEWVLITTIPYPYAGDLGPQGISNPSHNQSATDNSGRTWVYSDGSDSKTPAWYLNEDEIAQLSYKDQSIYIFLQNVKSKTLTQAKSIVQDILYSKKAIWYRVESIINIGGGRLDSSCGVTNSGRPSTTPPNMNLNFDVINSTPFEFSPPSIDGRVVNSDVVHSDLYYDTRKSSSENYARGFDDLNVVLSTPTYWGSFQFNNWDIDWDVLDATDPLDTFTTASVSAQSPRKVESTVNRDQTYYYPTQEGRLNLRPSANDPSGSKTVSVSGVYNDSCYELPVGASVTINGQKIIREGQVVIQEREPTPVFSLSANDSPIGRGSFAVSDNLISEYSSYSIDSYVTVFRRIVYGVASNLNIDFIDESVARTYPISSWFIHYDKSDSSFNKYIVPSLSQDMADEQQFRPSLSPYDTIVIPSTAYENPGIYYTTLVVEASGTSTGYDLSAINRLYVYPVPPSAMFTNLFSSNQDSVSAFVPIYFKATDQSLSNSISPISGWVWDVYDSYNRSFISDSYSFNLSANELEHNWKWHTDNYEQDNLTVNASLDNVCLTVSTSAYGRRGRTDGYGTTGLFIEGDSPISSNSKECSHVYLYERPPISDLSVIEAFTYTSAFSDDNPDFEELPAYTNGSFYVSGYAPYVNVVFNDASTPKSYPISSYKWNFDDYFNDLLNIDFKELPLNSESTGWEYPFPTDHGPNGDQNYPEWETSLTNHDTEHTFTLPGLYNVTLTVYASSTNTPHTTSMSVEVFELPPTCGYRASLDKINWFENSLPVSALSGESPLTVYFDTSGVEAGSFPIGKLIWDFGDGTAPVVIDRYVNNYNNQPFGSDPRGFNGGFVEHVFKRQAFSEPSTFTVNLSVIAENSNTLVSCDSGVDVGPVTLPSLDGGLHLIKNRSVELRNDNLYVFQRESDRSLFNISLSSG